MRPVGSEVARQCRASSQKQARLKTFELGADKVYEKLDMLKQGAISARYAKSTKAEIGTLLSGMRKAVTFELLEDKHRRALKGQLASIEKAVDTHATKAEGDILKSVPVRKRAAYKEVFDLIYECSTNRIAAKSLVDRMLDRLSRS
jgi:molecular chaperone HtpG